MSRTRLNPLDAAWIMTESRATPNHVGGLLIFSLPAGAPRDYMRRLMHDFRTFRGFSAPWNRRLRYAFTLNPVPEWVEDDDVDLEYHVRHAALPGMVQRRGGRIVNISSMAARAGLWRQAGYSASEAGLLGLTRNVALEHAADGISCNAVLPGLIETPAVASLPQPVMDYSMSLTPARRTGRTDEVAALVAFLLSDEAGYLNGAEIDIDGGAHLCPAVLGSVREAEARRAYHHPPPG